MEMRRGQDVELEEIERLLRRYRRVFRATGGGITLSGGEVLMQPAFARNVLRAAKELGIHTAIDTSGYLGAVAKDELLADVERHMAAERTRLAAIAHAEKAADRRREAREDAIEEARLIRKGGEWL